MPEAEYVGFPQTGQLARLVGSISGAGFRFFNLSSSIMHRSDQAGGEFHNASFD